jgi:hypothetical protein
MMELRDDRELGGYSLPVVVSAFVGVASEDFQAVVVIQWRAVLHLVSLQYNCIVAKAGDLDNITVFVCNGSHLFVFHRLVLAGLSICQMFPVLARWYGDNGI